MVPKFSSKGIDCEDLKKVPVIWDTSKMSGKTVHLIYTALLYLYENRQDFESKVDSFCPDCWIEYQYLLDEFADLMHHLYTEHNRNLN
jgi:hypothetical protein